jgi:hypothetical protein
MWLCWIFEKLLDEFAERKRLQYCLKLQKGLKKASCACLRGQGKPVCNYFL